MLTLIKPRADEASRGGRLDAVLDFALDFAGVGETVSLIETAKELEEADLNHSRILFAVCLSRTGINTEYYKMLAKIRETIGGIGGKPTEGMDRRETEGQIGGKTGEEAGASAGREEMFAGSVGGILVDGAGELYTKALARELAFAANCCGLTLPGKALVEATGSLDNFATIGKLLKKEPLEAYKLQAGELVKKIMDFSMEGIRKGKLLAVHAGNRATSNSLMLWDMVKSGLKGMDVQEIGIRNGEIIDCRGCPYEACRHFGESGQCFYGGVIVEQIYPAILEADTLVMICPNYNDAVSANIMAFINRLTALFRRNEKDFSRKRVYAIVVSGYSGGDLVAEQILGAMNFNKNMILPANFALVETANAPGSIRKVSEIEDRARIFSSQISKFA